MSATLDMAQVLNIVNAKRWISVGDPVPSAQTSKRGIHM